MWFRKQNKILREQSATTGKSVSTLLASLIIIVSNFNLEDSPQPFPAMRDDSSIRIVSRRRINYLENLLQSLRPVQSPQLEDLGKQKDILSPSLRVHNSGATLEVMPMALKNPLTQYSYKASAPARLGLPKEDPSVLSLYQFELGFI